MPHKLLRVFVDEADRHGTQPLYTAVVEAARRFGLAGATVFKGIEGYGSHAVVHAARVFDLSTNLPVLVEIVDEEAKIRAFLPELETLVRDGLMTLEAIEVVRFPLERPQ